MHVNTARTSAVIVHPVPTPYADCYLSWQQAITATAAQFEGYQGTDVYPPESDRNPNWIAVLHFADPEALQRWLDSPQRAEMLAKLPPEIASYSKTVLIQGFAPWFTQLLHKPPSWKMALTVLLALYPTSLLVNLLITPHLQGLGRASTILIGNAIGIALLQWGIIPRLTRVLKPWLSANDSHDRHISVLGGAAIVSILLFLAYCFDRWLF
ncbi:hypothetical protein VZH09_07045 [Synechococcus elongatus IITB7]|uniref:hypothetical protein n=1 Tax=Synechococcus elongatus TaxID=32046 RepID=UPI0030CFE8E7